MSKLVLRNGVTIEIVETPGCTHEVTYMTPQGVLFRSLPTTGKIADEILSALTEQGVAGLTYRLLPPQEAYAKLMGEVHTIRQEAEDTKKRRFYGLGTREEAEESKEEALLRLTERADELEAQARELPVN